jgi:NADH-quinone oxidoreductase subunit C
MQAQEIFDILKEEFADAVIDIIIAAPSDPYINIQPDSIVDVGLFLRDNKQLNFDYLCLLGGVDNKDNFEVVYQLTSVAIGHTVTIKIRTDHDNPKVPSVERVWKTANWHEREAYDMFGIIFEGHPNLIRILCPYDWEGYPLRKDYVTPEVYHGMKVPY